MASEKTKAFFSFIFSKLFLKQLGIAIGIVVVISIVALLSLSHYTHHGESVKVPNLKNKNITSAIPLLESLELNYEIIDSVYLADKPAGTVVEQTPSPNEKIKKFRKVYLTINSYSKPLVTLPDVRDLSYRNAKATLEALGVLVVKIEYVPSEYKDLVKDVKKGRLVLVPGARVTQGSRLTLVVGSTQVEGVEVSCPSFRGLRYDAAIQIANADSLNIRSVQFDAPPKNKADSSLFIVYKQEPIKGSPILIGSSINIWLSKDKTLLESPEEEFKILNEDSIKRTQNKKDIENFFE
jgi:beta-lactam-binding protein with PASTA domain